MINVFRMEAIRAVIGVASANDLMTTIIANEVFFDFNKVFRHRFDKVGFGGRISQVEN